MAAVSKEASADLDIETRALHQLLALDRCVQGIRDGEAPRRTPTAKSAFAVASTRRFRGPWERAVLAVDYIGAADILRRAIAALSRRIAKRTRTQQALINRLQRLQRKPFEFSAAPSRCAFCSATNQAGIDSGLLFICAECVQQAYEIVVEARGGRSAR